MTYIIGEIGQNHNGSIKIAKKLIDIATQSINDKLFNINLSKINAVKLTKRDLKFELSNSQMKSPYLNKNSFGKTYGEHRSFLELTENQHFECYKYSKEKNIDFIETLCAPSCLSILKLFTPDKLKIASRDLTNLPLIYSLAETKIPLILSTGMGGKKELDTALNIITKFHSNINILHCVSQYPTKPKNVNLNTINYLKEKYPIYKIGYSDHTVGISIPVAAVAMGAEIIEKHITLDRNMKGSDQLNSLGPDGIRRMIRDIRLLELSLGKKDFFISSETKDIQKKLERSIATNKKLKKNTIIKESDIHLLSPGDGFKWIQRNEVIGKRINQDLNSNEILYSKMLK